MANYDFFQHKNCEFFPCHKGVSEDAFSCMFCYCPLYALGDKCGGNFTYTPQGIKDCTNCTLPHRRENYLKVLSKMDMVMELAKKPEEDKE